MILGVGIDIIETERVAEKIAKEGGFREHVFSVSEIFYCESKTNHAENYAARFAAKEALLKALGTGFTLKISLPEIEVVSDEMGKPSFNIYGKLESIVKSRNISTIFLSLSHLKSIACAVVVIESL